MAIGILGTIGIAIINVLSRYGVRYLNNEITGKQLLKLIIVNAGVEVGQKGLEDMMVMKKDNQVCVKAIINGKAYNKCWEKK